jgi:RimJ/RimL family protein N-acetyltransferase
MVSLDSFSTPRLFAERLTNAHLPDLIRMDRDEAFMASLGGVRDEPETSIYLERNLEHWAEYGFGIWMLRDRETDAVIGRGVLRHLDVDGVDEVEVGYGFLPRFWGRGLATEVARACIDIGQRQLALPSIVAITRPTNLASQRVMEKAGLVREREIVHAGVPHVLFRTRDAHLPVADSRSIAPTS